MSKGVKILRVKQKRKKKVLWIFWMNIYLIVSKSAVLFVVIVVFGFV